ncbi:unnamed protein product, partial [marine sediment metagenome]
MWAHISLPSGIDESTKKQYQDRFEEVIQKKQYTDLFFNVSFDQGFFFWMQLKNFENRLRQKEVLKELQQSFDEIPGSTAYVTAWQLLNLDSEFGHAGQHKLIIRAKDSDAVQNGAELVADALRNLSEIAFVQPPTDDDFPTLLVDVDTNVAHAYGLTKDTIQRTLHEAYSRTLLGAIPNGTTQENIYMELQPQFRDKSDALSKINLVIDKDRIVPLKSVAKWKESVGKGAVSRNDSLYATNCYFTFTDGVSKEEALQK